MIQHIKVDSHPLLKSQIIRDLGRVNILTGRNSSGKTTILSIIAEKSDFGITLKTNEEVMSLIRGGIAQYTSPSPWEINDWVVRMIDRFNEKTFYSSSKDELNSLIQEAKRNSHARGYDLSYDTNRIVDSIISFIHKMRKVVILFPKRQLQYETEVKVSQKPDTDASNTLSRLFYLKNQVPDSDDRKLYEKIYSSFREITGREFDVQLLPEKHPPQIQLQFRRIESPWINAKSEGLGLSEVLSIILYSLDGRYDLVLIEEPESHLHPDLQRKLLSFLNSITDRQFILSTHSPVFLNPTMVDKIYLSKYVDNEIIISDSTNRAETLMELGVLAVDNLTSDAVVITEGKLDQVVISYILTKWLNVPSSNSISHVFLSGSMMVHFDPTPFAQIRNTFALLDLDTENKSAQKKFIENCKESGIVPTQLKRYCLENYYTLNAIKAVFKEIVPDNINELDGKTPQWKQLADSAHDEAWWKGELKSYRRINAILDNMTISDIDGTDLLEFCRSIQSTLKTAN